MKMYTNMTNIIVRLSCGPECDENAILLNAHYDTTLGSPGAADDALGCGVMMEILRIMSLRPAPKKNSIIFRTLQLSWLCFLNFCVMFVPLWARVRAWLLF